MDYLKTAFIPATTYLIVKTNEQRFSFESFVVSSVSTVELGYVGDDFIKNQVSARVKANLFFSAN